MKSNKEIENELHKRHLLIDSFRKEDDEPLYAIFKDVVESDSGFPYGDSSYAEFKKYFFSKGSSVWVCRSAEEEVLGGFFLKPNYYGRSDHIANAAYMVHRNARGKGIGRLLCEFSIHMAKRRGFQALQYNLVLSDNIKALTLYQKLGFEILGKIPKAIHNRDDTYQDGYIMYLEL